MPDIVQEVEMLLKNNYNRLSFKTDGRPMDTVAHAYILSLHADKMSQTEIEKMVHNIQMNNDLWADMMEKSLDAEGPNCTSEWEAVSICYISL